jgi:hypothetical protein
VTRKDVEDEHRAIDDRHWYDLFEILALARTKLVEHEQQVGAKLLRALGNLACFSAADQRRGIDLFSALHEPLEYARPRRVCERFELDQLGF